MTADHQDTEKMTTPGTSRRSVLRSGALIAGAGVVGLPAFTGSAAAHGCAFTPGYWKNHPEAWMPKDEDAHIHFTTSSDHADGQFYYYKTDDEETSCMDILWMKPKGDKTIIMAHHFIAAILNGRNDTQDWCVLGYDGPQGEGKNPTYDKSKDYIELAMEFFEKHPLGSGARKWDGYEYVKDKLVDYNEGRLCVCGD